VATALEMMMKNETTVSSTYELYGPTVYSMREIYDIIDDIMKKKRTRLNVPNPIALAITKLLTYLPWPYLTPDEIERYCISDKPGKAVGGGEVKAFGDLGVELVDLESKAIQVVRSYRSNTYFDQPISKDIGKVKKGVYHVEY
jgi:NADH dehydrogenase (ubiquinone) 1 alpha subcomplex subunit 9